MLFYCGDVQCKGKYGTYAKRLWAKHNVKLDITEQDNIVTQTYFYTNNPFEEYELQLVCHQVYILYPQ